MAPNTQGSPETAPTAPAAAKESAEPTAEVRDGASLSVGAALRQGDYRVLESLARSAHCTVYAAHQVRVGRRVAVKLRAGKAGRAASSAEAQVLAAVCSPFVIQIWDRHVEGDEAWLALEHGGVDLSAFDLQRSPLPLAVAVGIAADVLSGLEELHRAGYVHRAICPSHVLVNTDNVGDPTAAKLVKLAGFGWACAVASRLSETQDAQQLVASCGEFLAPEVIAGRPAEASADLYGVGRLMCALLGIAFELDVSAPGERVLDPELRAWLARALVHDPAERFTDAQGMRRALLDVPLSAEAEVRAEPSGQQPLLESASYFGPPESSSRDGRPTPATFFGGSESSAHGEAAEAAADASRASAGAERPVESTHVNVIQKTVAADMPTAIGASPVERFSPEHTPTRYMMVPSRPAQSTALSPLPNSPLQHHLSPRQVQRAYGASTQRLRRRSEGTGQGFIVATGLLCLATIYWASNIDDDGIGEICATVDCDGVSAWSRDVYFNVRDRASEWSQRGAETTVRFVDLAIERADEVLHPPEDRP